MRRSLAIPRGYGGRSRGVFDTLTYPHLILMLILPYSAYYGHLAPHYSCKGGLSLVLPSLDLYPGGAIRKHIQVPEASIYGEWSVYRFLVCSIWKVPIQSRPHTIF
jgi:hypothetical protein